MPPRRMVGIVPHPLAFQDSGQLGGWARCAGICGRIAGERPPSWSDRAHPDAAHTSFRRLPCQSSRVSWGMRAPGASPAACIHRGLCRLKTWLRRLMPLNPGTTPPPPGGYVVAARATSEPQNLSGITLQFFFLELQKFPTRRRDQKFPTGFPMIFNLYF